jgi:hypothetical protein
LRAVEAVTSTDILSHTSIASESEYAAWTLLHGYALNHLTVSVHRLQKMRGIDQINQFLQEQSIKLNSEGGVLKGPSASTIF